MTSGEEREAEGGGGRIVVVMGVSGCGKSTIAERLSERLGAHFRDGDEFHPSENIRKMSDGEPLTDADRQPWLETVREYAVRAAGEHGTCVIACSALKRAYRDTLSGERADEGARVPTFFVFLDGSRELIASRMSSRRGHFMPESMLDSQFETLESPVGEPRVVAVDIAPEPEDIALAAAKALGAHPEFNRPDRP